MKDRTNILVSSIAFHSGRIGSWTTRLNTFLKKNPDFFDYVLSPTPSEGKYIQCKKGKFPTYHPKLRETVLQKVVAKDYLTAFRKIAATHNRVRIVVMDDAHLLEAFVKAKPKWEGHMELVFSYHGYQCPLPHQLLHGVDKMLFLTKRGYLATKDSLFSFTPEVHVVGNAVDSETFFPISKEEKGQRRKELELDPSHKIICWMANERPIKGFALFQKMVHRLSDRHQNLTFLVIGVEKKGKEGNCIYLGRLPNTELPKYLQVSDIYLFTSLCREGFGLSVVEALKCGNYVLASDNGGIPEVLEGLPNQELIRYPNIVNEWIQKIEGVLERTESLELSKEQAAAIWNYEHWEQKFMDAINA